MNIKSCVVFATLIAACFCQTQTLSYSSIDSSNAGDFQFNGVASYGGGRIVLTPSSNSVAGSVFYKQSIPLTGPNGFTASFSTAFTIIMDQGVGGDGTGDGADGIVFVLNTVSNTAGSIGGGIGYSGIQRSVGIEFDTWYNPEFGDRDGNHVGVNTNGSPTSLQQQYYSVLFNNGAPTYVWVDYDGSSQTLEVRVSAVDVRPVTPFISRVIDLVGILQSPNVYVGWTAATGGSRERHMVSAFRFTNDYAPIVTPVPTSVCGNGIIEGSEACDGGSCCTSTCTFAATSVTCRASTGDCDVAETCTGSSSTCPADSFASSSTVCRAANGVCDAAETCTGTSGSCPADSFASASTVCRAAAGVCDLAEFCTGSSTSCPADAMFDSTTTCRPSVGPCDTAEVCSGTSATCGPDVSGSFETACPGLTLNINGQPTSWLNFDVISFNNFTATTGDVEGRLAVKHSAVIGNGWSVGYQIHGIATDRTYAYSMVVGDNLSFGSGAVYPDGSGRPFAGSAEGIFVGGTFSSASSDLAGRVTGNCNGASGCLNSQFDAVQQCYGGYQSTMASQPTNVASTVQWSGLYVTCNSVNDNTYYLDLTPAQMSQYTWTQLTNCNSNARWIINIRGTGDVSFSGGSFPADASQIVYNIVGSGRTINVANTNLNGNVVAPYNIVRQSTSVINGKVIASDIVASWQMNRGQCFRA